MRSGGRLWEGLEESIERMQQRAREAMRTLSHSNTPNTDLVRRINAQMLAGLEVRPAAQRQADNRRRQLAQWKGVRVAAVRQAIDLLKEKYMPSAASFVGDDCDGWKAYLPTHPPVHFYTFAFTRAYCNTSLAYWSTLD
jgi:hypothetical protein